MTIFICPNCGSMRTDTGGVCMECGTNTIPPAIYKPKKVGEMTISTTTTIEYETIQYDLWS